MKFPFVLIFFFFLGVLAETGLTQNKAQASMTVSVKVVSTPTLSFTKSNLSKSENSPFSEMGELNLKNFSDGSTLIQFPESITLSDSSGNKVELHIETVEKDGTVGIKGTSKDSERKSGEAYRGTILATVEHI